MLRCLRQRAEHRHQDLRQRRRQPLAGQGLKALTQLQRTMSKYVRHRENDWRSFCPVNEVVIKIEILCSQAVRSTSALHRFGFPEVLHGRHKKREPATCVTFRF